MVNPYSRLISFGLQARLKYLALLLTRAILVLALPTAVWIAVEFALSADWFNALLLIGVAGVTLVGLLRTNTLTPPPVREVITIENYPMSKPLFEKTTARWWAYPVGRYVYVIQDVDVSRYCKIGRTNKPSKRLQRFDVVLPFKFNVVAVIPSSDEYALEKLLHERYADKRAEGEWFNLDTEDVQALKALEKQAAT